MAPLLLLLHGDLQLLEQQLLLPLVQLGLPLGEPLLVDLLLSLGLHQVHLKVVQLLKKNMN